MHRFYLVVKSFEQRYHLPFLMNQMSIQSLRGFHSSSTSIQLALHSNQFRTIFSHRQRAKNITAHDVCLKNVEPTSTQSSKSFHNRFWDQLLGFVSKFFRKSCLLEASVKEAERVIMLVFFRFRMYSSN